MMNNYPAEHYGMVIFASGGIGWQGYYIGDKDGDGVSARLPDFANTLEDVVKKTGKKIDVLIGSCAVNMIEIAYELQNSVNYIVGTQDCLPETHIMPIFFNAVSKLKNDTGLTPEEFAIQGPLSLSLIHI